MGAYEFTSGVQYTLTMQVSGSGTTSPAAGSSSHYDGQVITVEAIPESGWQFDGWSGALAVTENPTTIAMDADQTVIATFSQIVYNLSVSTFSSGSVTLSPAGGTYAEG